MRRAFTLIEVLVVIAIVALLVGIMVPSLASARGAGMSLVCASNARQLQTANAVYAADHEAKFAPGAADFRGNLQRWHGSRPSPSHAFAANNAPLQPYIGDNAGTSAALRSCPSFARQIEADRDVPAARTGAFEQSAGGYGYNNAFVGTLQGRVGAKELDTWRVITDRTGSPEHLFARPSETMAFADAAFPSDRAAAGLIEYSFLEPRFQPAFGKPHRADPSIHFCHSEQANIAHLDGHVSPATMTFSWSSGLYPATPESANVGWPGEHDTNRGFGYR